MQPGRMSGDGGWDRGVGGSVGIRWAKKAPSARLAGVVGVLLLTAAGFSVNRAAAQTVLVTVQGAEDGRPIFGALAYLYREDGSLVRNLLTDERGRGIFVGVEPGRYRLEAQMIGRATTSTEVFPVSSGETVRRELRLASSAISLEGIEVAAEGGRCRVRPEEGLLVARVWDEARKALEAAAFTEAQAAYEYRIVRYVRDLDRNTRTVERERTERTGGYLRRPFESRPAEDLLEHGFVQSTDEGDLYFAPDAGVLLSDAFLDTHCFGLETGSGEAEGLVGLSFRPAGRKRVAEIAGTLWLDPNTSELRWLDYRYQNLNPDLTSPDVGGRVEFMRLPDGTWIVPAWRIRMPTVGMVRDARGRRQPYLEAYRDVGGTVVRVREPGGRTVLEAERGSIEGVVLDSLEAEAVPGARVAVVGTGQTFTTDTEGRFRMGGLEEGAYRLSFSHPALDALGFQPEPVRVEVRRGRVTPVRFRMPSRGELLFEVCRGEERPEGTAALVGWVRDATSGVGLPQAVVRIEWQGWTFPSKGTRTWGRFILEGRGVEAHADEGGAFRACAVPTDRLLRVTASYQGAEGAADTLTVEKGEGVEARTFALEVKGLAVVEGTVRHEGTGEPVPGARVLLPGRDGTPRTAAVTDGSGRFTLSGLAAGVYDLRVEADGMVPWSGRVTLPPLGRTQVDIVLVPSGGEGSLSGQSADGAAPWRAAADGAGRRDHAPDSLPARYQAFVRRAFDGRRAREVVAFMEPYVRLPGNEGFDATIRKVEEILRDAGYRREVQGGGAAEEGGVRDGGGAGTGRLTYRVERRPLDRPTWEPVDASLTIVGEESPLLTFRENHNLMALYSFPTPEGGVEAPLVEVGPGRPEDFEGKDVRGKIVFGEARVGRLFREAVARGALGVVAYSIPELNRPDINRSVISYQSVPLDTAARAWGLQLTTEARDRLRAALDRGPVRLRVETEARIYESEELTLVAEVHGSARPEERFVFSAHVQEAGANDNASGVGALSEIARVLAAGVQEGAFDPARTITMIWGDEISSTRRYLQEYAGRAAGVRWGMSLDMVGEDTERTGGTFLIEKMPDPSAVWTRGDDRHTEWGGRPLSVDELTPHYFNDFVLRRCRDQAADNGWVVRTNPFEGGSDHVPFLRAGVAGLLLWHFTDVFYHTDGDRLANVSAQTLQNVGVCAAVSAMILTSADEALTLQLVAEVEEAALERLSREATLSREALAGGGDPAEERRILQTWTTWYEHALGAMADIPVDGPTPGVQARIGRAREAVRRAGNAALGSVAGG